MSANASENLALHEALAAIVGADRVLSSEVDRAAYARDCWPRTTIGARDRVERGVRPRLIVQPATQAEVVRIVELAAARGVPLVPYGAGSGVCGAAVPQVENTALTIDLKRLRHIELDAARLRARVGPGVIGQHLETTLQRAGLTLGHYPSSLYCSSLGGYLAGRSAGQYSSRYGKIEDLVESLTLVHGRGELLDTAEAARRGDLDALQLVVGSEGTLGIITDAVVRLQPLPEHRWYRGYLLPTVEAGTEAMRELMQAGVQPAVLRLYDELDTLMASKTHQGSDAHDDVATDTLITRLFERARGAVGDAVERGSLAQRVARTARGLMGRVLGAPMLLNQAVRLVPGGCMLIVGLEGPRALVEAEASLVARLVGRHGEDLGAGPGEHWYAHRFGVSYKMSPLMDTGAFSDTMEVSTRWSNLMDLYARVREAMSRHVLLMAHFSHAYHDGCSIYFTFAGFAKGHDETLALYDRTWEAGLGAVAAAGASVAHHHGVGVSKAPYTPYDHPGGAPLMRALKRTFDPAGIFNPGKVWPEAVLAEASR